MKTSMNGIFLNEVRAMFLDEMKNENDVMVKTCIYIYCIEI